MENGIWKNLPLWGDPGKSNLFCVRGWLLGKDGGVAESVEIRVQVNPTKSDLFS